MSLPGIKFLHLMLSKIQPKQDFQTQCQNSKVKSQINSHLDVEHLYTLAYVPTKYQHPTLHGF